MSKKNMARRRKVEKNNDVGMIKLTGLWKKEGKDGVFYSGKLSYNTNILLFPNKYKQSEKDPALILFIAKAEKKEKSKPEVEEDEIPF